MTNTREKIIELAQEAIASRGYSAFSFRELAAELGIKSASVHYHFPTKTHLGLEVARRYRNRLQASLEQIVHQSSDPRDALRGLVAIYRYEAATSHRMTVCTMLAAEIKNLPDEIQREMKVFYELNLVWIQARLDDLKLVNSADKALQIFALLQGGLLGAKSQNDPTYFDRVADAMTLLV